MSCYHPIECWRSNEGRDPRSGKWKLVFKREEGMVGYPSLKIACGGCIGCRLEKARAWALRCVQEAKLHERNCFLTLTYNNEKVIERCGVYDEEKNCISQLSLNKRDFVLFMKKLRRWYEKKHERKIRFYHCGEYGELYGRPHHHVCCFGLDFEDKRLVRDGECRLYHSVKLDELWEYGYCTIGEVTYDSAAYVAKYVTKKIYGEMADTWYDGIQPEYCTMSRRPGIGREWFEKYNSDVYNLDQVVVLKNNGSLNLRPPKYYDYLYDKLEPKKLEQIKIERRKKASKRQSENTYERLKVREERMSLKMKQKIRNYETKENV